ncbi:MAG: YihY/virulence factor BrkB family protein [Pseudomonadota bacterium]
MTGLWRALRGAVRAFIDHDGSALAGFIAFSLLLALFPFAIVAVMTASLVIGADESLSAVQTLVELLPAELTGTIEPALLGVISVDRGSVLTVSALIALWSASSGVEAFRTAFDRAYGVGEGRGWWRNRLQSLLIVLLGVVTFIIVGVAVLLGPLLIGFAERWLEGTVPGTVDALRYAAGIGAFLAFLFLLHRFLPPHPPPMLWPGVLVTTLLFTAAATGFSLYLALAPSFALTYGAMAGVVVMMLFFYLTGIVIIFGAELNAGLARRRAG